MKTQTKAILSGSLLTALFTALVAGQTAIAGQDSDEGVFAELSANTVIETTNKVRFDAPVYDAEETVSGRK